MEKVKRTWLFVVMSLTSLGLGFYFDIVPCVADQVADWHGQWQRSRLLANWKSHYQKNIATMRGQLELMNNELRQVRDKLEKNQATRQKLHQRHSRYDNIMLTFTQKMQQLPDATATFTFAERQYNQQTAGDQWRLWGKELVLLKEYCAIIDGQVQKRQAIIQKLQEQIALAQTKITEWEIKGEKLWLHKIASESPQPKNFSLNQANQEAANLLQILSASLLTSQQTGDDMAQTDKVISERPQATLLTLHQAERNIHRKDQPQPKLSEVDRLLQEYRRRAETKQAATTK